MSIYSDYKVGAIDEEEFQFLCAEENRKDRIDRESYWKDAFEEDDWEEEDEQSDNSN